jgi:hypothetical protein
VDVADVPVTGGASVPHRAETARSPERSAGSAAHSLVGGLPAWAGWLACNLLPVVAAAALVAALTPATQSASVGVLAHVTLLGGAAALQGAWVTRVGLRGWRWAVHTVAGLALGGVVGIALLVTLDGVGYELAGTLLGVSAFGLGMSVPQHRLLRRAGRAPDWWLAWWVLASVTGWLAGGAVWHLAWRSVPLRTALGRALPFFAPDALPGQNEVSLLATALVCYAAVTAAVASRVLAPRSLGWRASRRP